MVSNQNRNPEDVIKITIILVVMACLGMLMMCQKCHAQTVAQIDTMVCNVNCIQKFVEVPSTNGKTTRVYAVYKDSRADINDLIPVSRSVYQYIEQCKAYAIEPNLGIRLRNGQISSIIRFKPRYVRKR